MLKHLNIPPVWTLIAIAATIVLHYLYPLVIFNFRAMFGLSARKRRLFHDKSQLH